MPKYRVKSGSLDRVVETPYPAEPVAISIMAFVAAQQENNINDLGKLIEVRGGKYKGDNTMYVSTVRVLKDMGMLDTLYQKVAEFEGDD